MRITIVKGMFQIENSYIRGVTNYKKFKEDTEDLKASLSGRSWDGELKVWKAPINERNAFWVKYQLGDNPYALYETPLDEDLWKKVIEKHPISKPLRKAQKPMVSRMIQYRRTVEAAEMRLGKTLCFILASKYLDLPAWFITPKTAIEDIKLELEKWNYSGNTVVMTYHKFTELLQVVPDQVPPIVCFDECQALKDPTSKRGKTARELKRAMSSKYGNDYYIWLLSGTPDSKDPLDWWNLCEILEPGFLRESNKNLLKNRICHTYKQETATGRTVNAIDKTKGKKGFIEEEIKALGKRMSGLVQVYTVDDYTDLDPLEFVEKRCNISGKVANAIRLISKTKSGIELQNMLRQIDDGFLYQYHPIDPVTLKKERKASLEFYTGKDEVFNEYLDHFSQTTGRLVAYAAFTESVNKITDMAVAKGWSVIKISESREIAIGDHSLKELKLALDADRDDGTVDKVIAISQCDCGNLGKEYSASNTIIFYSNSNKLGERRQATFRINSENSKHKRKFIIDLIHMKISEILLQNHKDKKEVTDIPKEELMGSIRDDLNRLPQEEKDESTGS